MEMGHIWAKWAMNGSRQTHHEDTKRTMLAWKPVIVVCRL